MRFVKRAPVLLILLLARPLLAAALPSPWIPLGPFGGLVTALATDSLHPGTVYAVTPQGVFKTVDAGVSWRTVYAGEPVSNLALDPLHPRTLYVVDRLRTLLKSTDGGAHWTYSGNGLSANPENPRWTVAVDPAVPSRLLATDGQRLWRSTDAGGLWFRVSEIESGLPSGATIQDVVLSARPAGTAFLATSAGVYRSADGGANWKAARRGLPAASAAALAVAPSDPKTVYAAFPGLGLYRTTDGGASWQKRAGPAGAFTEALTVSPFSSATLYARGEAGLVRSLDGGVRWSPLPGSRDALAVALDPRTRGRIYAGAGRFTVLGGVLRSDDGGASWVRRSQGMTGIATRSVAVDPADPDRLWTSTGTGILFRSEDRGARWTRLPALPLRTASELAAGEGSGLFALTGESPSVLAKSPDGGDSWTVSLGDPAALAVLRFRIAPSDSSTLYAVTVDRQNTQSLYRSTDAGVTWEARAIGGVALGCPFRDLAVAPSAAEILYLAVNVPQIPLPGGCDSPVLRSADGGVTWTKGDPASPPQGTPTVLAVDPHDPGVVYLGTDRHGLYKSSNGGQTWVLSNQGIAGNEITALLASTIPGRLYAATPGGRIYRSDDGGASWQGRNRGLITSRIVELIADPNDPRRIYAATANGTWTLAE